MQAQREDPAPYSASKTNKDIEFRASTFRLQPIRRDKQTWAPLSMQHLQRSHMSRLKAAQPQQLAAGSFFLEDDSSSSNIEGSNEQHGTPQIAAPPSRRGVPVVDFTLTYAHMAGARQDLGIVPVITVGSAFTLVKQRYASVSASASVSVSVYCTRLLCCKARPMVQGVVCCPLSVQQVPFCVQSLAMDRSVSCTGRQATPSACSHARRKTNDRLRAKCRSGPTHNFQPFKVGASGRWHESTLYNLSVIYSV